MKTFCVNKSVAFVMAMGVFSDFASAVMPSSPETDPKFGLLPNGKTLSSVKVNGVSLSLAKGTGTTFGPSQRASYKRLKNETQVNPNSKIQWTLMDLDSGRVVDQSASPGKRIFGASSSKIFVAGALLDKQVGQISASQLNLMASMIVVSSNTAWTNLQTQLGDGNSNKGRERNYQFTQRMGYKKTLGFQGWWGSLHGNELTAIETAQFLHDTYKGLYPGAEYLWKLMYTCRTGASRGRKYLPKSVFVGGKTGTYDGSTYDTDLKKNVSVRVRNHVLVFNSKGTQYGLSILADSGSDETAALLAGGLFEEYVK